MKSSFFCRFFQMKILLRMTCWNLLSSYSFPNFWSCFRKNSCNFCCLNSWCCPCSFQSFGNRLRTFCNYCYGEPTCQKIGNSGYYDLATPYFATDYTVDHMQLDPALRGNLVTEYYEAGHMMYIHEPSAEALAADLSSFYADALAD